MLLILHGAWDIQMQAPASVPVTNKGSHLCSVWVGNVASVADGAFGHTTSSAAQAGMHFSAIPMSLNLLMPYICLVLYYYRLELCI